MSFLEDSRGDTGRHPLGHSQTGLGRAKTVLYDPNSQCAKDYDAAVARAKEAGGCVAATQCQYLSRPAVCFDDPRAKPDVINQIKSLEIEAGGLEALIEMAEAPDANTLAAEEDVIAESDQLLVEVSELQAAADAARSRIADAENARNVMLTQRDALLRALGVAS